MATSIDNVILVFTARGINRVQRQLSAVGATSDRTRKSVVGLGGAISGLGALLAVRQVVAYADSYTELQNRMRLVTNSSEEVANATQNIFDIASRTRGNIEETSRTYFRFARANERLGLSEKELLSITETVNQAVAFSGTSALSASSALFQFSQGIAAGTLRGQELNSVLEQIPGLAEVLARGLGVGVDQLRKLGEAGKLTGQQLAQALLSQREFAQEQFGRIIFSVSQEFEGLRTEIIRYIGEVDKASGASRKLAETIRWMALNVDLLVQGLKVVGVLLARAFAPKIIAAARALAVALAANPVGALIVAVSTLVTVLVGFREEVVLIESSGATLGTAMEVTFNKIKTGAVAAFGAATKAASDLFLQLTGQRPREAFNDLLGVTGDGLDGVLDAMRQFANPAIGLLTLPVRAAIELWGELPSALGDLLFQTLETLRQIVTGTFDWEGFWSGVTQFVIDVFGNAFDFVVEKGEAAFNALRNLDFELPEITIPDINFDFLDTPIENRFEGSIERFGEGLGKVINDTFNRDFVGEAGDIVEKIKTQVIDPLIKDINAAQAAKDALAEGGPPIPSDVAPETADRTVATAEQIKMIETLTKRFQSQGNKLRENIEFLRAFRDEVAKFGPDVFGVTVDQVDAALEELEHRIAGTVDLIPALFEGAAEAARSSLVDILIDPLNVNLKDLARSFAQTMQRIVAEAIAAQAVLAALNFLQGFTSFSIPGATRTPMPAGSAMGQPAIGGQARLVGEHGPEVIIPSSRSNVITNDQLMGGGGDNTAVRNELRVLAQTLANMPAPTVVNINEQDPEGLLEVNRTRAGVRENRNFVTADARRINRTLGRR